MMQEGKVQSWRMDYIVDTHVRKMIADAQALLGFQIDPHAYYVLVDAGALVFSMEHECERLFDINPCKEEFIRRHARIVSDLLRQIGEGATGS